MLQASILLVVGLILLMWSADKLVYGSSAVARNFGISPLVIGMTIIALGSSAPEMVVSASAAFEGKTDIAVGNVLGSNITNIALILGCSALLRPLLINSTIIRKELPMMLAITLGCGAILWDSQLARVEGFILIALFAVFTLIMLKGARADNQSATALSESAALEKPSEKNALTPEPASDSADEEKITNLKATFWIVVGLALLILSANLIIHNAVIIAKAFGLSDLVIGLTIIAIGTSLPELAASIASVLKQEDDMAVGNIIGSNIFNILIVMGLPALIQPAQLSPFAMHRDFYVMLTFSVLLFLFAFGKKRVINRFEGAALLTGFIAYQSYLFFSATA
ncbi:MAG: calcium/sodium antiporter [Vibrionaceae bacterium]